MSPKLVVDKRYTFIMSTTKRRLNISLSKEVDEAITALAKRDQVPAATKISQLLQLSLTQEEDQLLSELAEARLQTSGQKLAGADVWQ
jgi:predicted DNA-binding protein